MVLNSFNSTQALTANTLKKSTRTAVYEAKYKRKFIRFIDANGSWTA